MRLEESDFVDDFWVRLGGLRRFLKYIEMYLTKVPKKEQVLPT